MAYCLCIQIKGSELVSPAAVFVSFCNAPLTLRGRLEVNLFTNNQRTWRDTRRPRIPLENRITSVSLSVMNEGSFRCLIGITLYKWIFWRENAGSY